jgi:hypothetical protein
LQGIKQMKVVLLSLALLGQPVTILVSDKVPVLNVEALCKATVEDDKANGIADAQSFPTCMQDENEAQQQLSPIWAASTKADRDRCVASAEIGGQSYVDLLTCLQATYIVEHPNASPQALQALRGASQNRNKQ